MEQNEEVIIDVKIDAEKTIERLGVLNKSMSDLKEQQKALREEIKKNGDATGELTAKMGVNEKSINAIKAEQKSLIGIMQSGEQQAFALGDSYNEVNARLSQLQKEYKSLSAEQRNSEGGKAMLAQIAEQKNQLKQLDATMGDYQRNVGNYAGSLSPYFKSLDNGLSKLGISLNDTLSGGFSSVTSAVKNAGGQFLHFGKILLASPIGWLALAVGAAVAVLSKLQDAIKRNDDASTNFSVALKNFQPLFTMFNKLLDVTVVALSKFAVILGNVANTIMSAVVPAYAEMADKAKEAEMAQDRLQDAERDYSVNSAKRQKEIAELRAKVAEKDKYTAKEREEMLKRAVDLERENMEDSLKIAKEKERLIKQKYEEEVNTSDEAKDAIAKAEAETFKAEADFAEKSRSLNKQLASFRQEQNEALKKQSEERIKKIEEENAKEGERVKIQAELSKMLTDAITANMEDGTEKELTILNAKYDEEIQRIKEKFTNEELLTAEAQATLTALIAEKEKSREIELQAIKDEELQAKQELEAERLDALNAFLQEKQAELNECNAEWELEQMRLQHETKIEELTAMLTAEGELSEELQQAIHASIEAENDSFNKKIAEANERALLSQEKLQKERLTKFGEVLGSFSNLIDAIDDKSEASAKASKVLALGQIAINTGIAIAEGVATAMRASNWIEALVAVATTVTTVVANMATAISSVKSAKFARGGIVEGTSFTGDKVPIRVNSGEMILNREQQAQLFDIANGRQASEGMNYELLASAMANTPPPVLDYREFTNFEGKVAKMDEMATL